MEGSKSIITQPKVTYQTAPASMTPHVAWDVDRFEKLIQTQGYDALIDRAMRCPCVDKNHGQALSTCRNCLGRGWFFLDRTETRVISQSMDSRKSYQEWSEVNRGTARITTKGIDKLGFMDRIILTQLTEYYSEVLNPFIEEDESIVAYPIYEPLQITNIYLFSSDSEKLVPLTPNEYAINENKIVFDKNIINKVTLSGMTFDTTQPIPLSISVRYSHYPVYHVIDVNRELMKVRESKLCTYDDEHLRQMPINVIARKAHWIFNAQTYGQSMFDNSVVPGVERSNY